MKGCTYNATSRLRHAVVLNLHGPSVNFLAVEAVCNGATNCVKLQLRQQALQRYSPIAAWALCGFPTRTIPYPLDVPSKPVLISALIRLNGPKMVRSSSTLTFQARLPTNKAFPAICCWGCWLGMKPCPLPPMPPFWNPLPPFWNPLPPFWNPLPPLPPANPLPPWNPFPLPPASG